MEGQSTENPKSELKKKPRKPILLILNSGKSIRHLIINLIYEENIKYIDYLMQGNETIYFNKKRKKEKKKLS